MLEADRRPARGAAPDDDDARLEESDDGARLPPDDHLDQPRARAGRIVAFGLGSALRFEHAGATAWAGFNWRRLFPRSPAPRRY